MPSGTGTEGDTAPDDSHSAMVMEEEEVDDGKEVHTTTATDELVDELVASRSEDSESSSHIPPEFLPNQKVICGDVNNATHYYEAVIRKVKCISVQDNLWNFQVHYQGWNSRWDRWVSADELVEDSPENRKTHLRPAAPPPATPSIPTPTSGPVSSLAPSTPKSKTTSSSMTTTKKRKSTDAPVSSSTSSSGRKRKTATVGKATTVVEASQTKAYEEYCELPFTLQTILVDELAYITRKGFDASHLYDCVLPARPARSVHVLPADITVHQVLQHYQKKRGGSKEADATKREQVRQFCQGLQVLFDEALPVGLLYPEEYPQYESILKKKNDKQKKNSKDNDNHHDDDDHHHTHTHTYKAETRLSEIYGCEFLLRLLVRMPYLLVVESEREMDVHGPLLGDLIVLLQKNRQACFKPQYREPTYEELLDWEKELADTAACQESASTTTVMTNSNINTDMAITPTKPRPHSSSAAAMAQTPSSAQKMES